MLRFMESICCRNVMDKLCLLLTAISFRLDSFDLGGLMIIVEILSTKFLSIG